MLLINVLCNFSVTKFKLANQTDLIAFKLNYTCRCISLSLYNYNSHISIIPQYRYVSNIHGFVQLYIYPIFKVNT